MTGSGSTGAAPTIPASTAVGSRHGAAGGWVLAALVALLLLVASVPISSAAGTVPVVIAVLLSLAGGFSLRRPVTGAVIVGVVLTLGIGHGPPHLGSGILASPVAVAACAARGHLLTAIAMAAWHLLPPTISALLRGDDPEFLVAQALLWVVLETTAVLAGTWGGGLAHRIHLERSRRISDLAEQRRAIARELHDTGVRAMTRVVMLSESAAGRPDIAAADAQRFAQIAATARQGTLELRDLLDVLRIEDTARSPISTTSAAGGEDRRPLDGLLEAMRLRLAAEGFSARVELDGEPSRAVSRSGILERCLRELEANVVRHGDRGAPVAVLGEVRSVTAAGCEGTEHDAEFADGGGTDDGDTDGGSADEGAGSERTASGVDLELLVRNGVARHPAPAPAGGAGLDGVRERLTAVGGRVETRREGPWFLTRLLVPLEASAPATPGAPAASGAPSARDGTEDAAPPSASRTTPQPMEAPT
ncbi:histidine kinase [Brachybacterium sp. AOP43-C2-M15]|uniref:histidine kinase n=1 Tax=Brachybacterium sp. AOP43-C2-M15 TaxID=3457661 RepID=UPI0040334E94